MAVLLTYSTFYPIYQKLPSDQTGTIFEPLPLILFPKFPLAIKLASLTNALLPATAVKFANGTGMVIIFLAEVIVPTALILPVADI